MTDTNPPQPTRTRGRSTPVTDRVAKGEVLLEVEDLQVEFRTKAGVAHAVNGVNYTLRAGETLAVLGESGSGKSVTAQAVMGLSLIHI